MFEVKNKNKALLAEYDLNLELFNQFELKVKDVIPIRNVFLIKAESGEFILKKIDYSIEELKFIIEATSYIKKSFNNIVTFKSNSKNQVYIRWENEIYCLMESIKGREGEFENPVDVALVARTLGNFHKASQGFYEVCQTRNNCGKTISTFNRRLEEIKFFKSIVNSYEQKNEFDLLFIKHVDYYIDQIEKSINILKGSNYDSLCKEEDKVAFCHQDLAHHNIIILDEQAYLIDFDYATMDLKVNDLCNFINKAVKNVVYDFEKAQLIIKEYGNVNTLTREEIKVLYGLLTFPHDFYEISRDFYTRRKNWQEEIFVYRFKKKLELAEDNLDFLNKWDSYYN